MGVSTTSSSGASGTNSCKPPSGRAEAVEAIGVVCPLGIGEIGEAACEAVGRDWGPVRLTVQVDGSFDDYVGICCPGYAKSERVGSNAKAGAEGQDDRIRSIPRSGRASGIGGAPTEGPRQVIDRHIRS